MGVFDDLKQQRSGTLTVVPAPREPVARRDGLHPYAAAIRDAWLSRLDSLARPWVRGAAWDTNCFVTARKLVELANSPWAGYGMTEAREDYLAHAPFDGVWDKREKCWEQAQRSSSGTSALPEPDPATPVPTVTVLDLDAEVATATGPPVNPIIDWHDLFATDDDGEEWIIEPLLPARRMVALYSAPKAGKSLLMLEIAVAIARGSEVIGSRPDRPYRVLYVDFENDPRGDVRTRLEAMEVGPNELDNLCYLTFPSLAKFDTAQGALDLLRHVEHYECEVVVIDTVSRAVMGEENENDTWLAFYRHTGLALKRAEVACIRLDHSGKDSAKGMRGGSAKYGDVDAVWRLTSIGEDTIALECTDNRMPVPVKQLTLIRQEFPLSHRVAGDAWQAVTDAKVHEVDQRLDALGVPSSASVREAREALRRAGDKVAQGPLAKAVRLRKQRLDMPSDGCDRNTSVTPGNTRGELLRPPPPVGGRRNTPGGTSVTPTSDDPDLLVSCKRCFRPTSQGVASRNGGLCANCFRSTGQTHEEDA